MMLPTSYNQYAKIINNIPYLEKDEERELLAKAQQKNCRQSIHKLVKHNLKNVYNLVNNYRFSGVDKDDLFQEGSFALYNSIFKFNLDQDVRFCSYYVYSVKESMLNYIHSNSGIVKFATTKEKKKIQNNFNSMSTNYTEAEFNDISTKLGVDVSKVRDAVSYQQCGLTIEVDGDEIEIPGLGIEYDYCEQIHEAQVNERLSKALTKLSNDDYDIIKRTMLEDGSLSAMARENNVSPQAFHHKRERIIKYLRKEMCDG